MKVEMGSLQIKQVSHVILLVTKKAIDLGSSEAYVNLEVLYSFVKGLQQNLEKALELFKKSSYMENSTGCFNAAHCYEEGIGTAKNASKAIENFKKTNNLDTLMLRIDLKNTNVTF